jgi:ATP-dependent Lhr-like helicase
MRSAEDRSTFGIVAVHARVECALAAGGDELAGVVAEWLRASGPVEPARLAAAFGLGTETLTAVLADLVEEEVVVVDRLLAGIAEMQVCDRQNLESLLRLSRSRARPRLEPLPIGRLARFIASRQGLVPSTAGVAGVDGDPAGGRDPRERLRGALERLFGFGLPVRLWEEEVLPARIEGYRAVMLDELAGSSGLGWFGCGKRKVGIAFPEDFELYLGSGAGSDAEPGAAEGLDRVFPDRSGRFGFWDLADSSRLPSAELSDRLWDAAWAGVVSNDSFAVLRRGVQNRFAAVELARDGGAATGRRSPARRAGFTRWQSSRPATGRWYRIDAPSAAGDEAEGADVAGGVDLVGVEELNRDRVRQLAARYGVLFRELLENELPALRWPALFRTLRIMELSGELVTGRFFDGIGGPQFALPGIAAELPARDAAEPTWWLNACDPASLCGVPVRVEGASRPDPTSHVVYRGDAVVLVSRRSGRDLAFAAPPDDPRLSECLAVFHAMVGRDVQAASAVHVETINGVSAPEIPYRAVLLAVVFAEDFRRLSLRASA